MAALTKTVDGKPLTEDQFAYVGDSSDISTWHLPVDKDHVKSAVDMFGHEKHVPTDKKAATARKIAAKAKAAGVDTSDFEKKYCGTEHADFGNGWVEIFRAGDYGQKGTFSQCDLDRVIANYDPDTHEAPACIGHPKDNMPAYGWASRLMRQGDTLLAKFKEVDPAFESAVKAGRFKKRSAAFYLDTSGRIANLRHVGFLGAQPPEVKGLKNLNFDDGDQIYTEVDFGEEETVAAETSKTFEEQFKAFLAKIFGGESATKTFSEADVVRIVAEATKPLTEQVTKLQGDIAAQTQKFSEREQKIATGETKQRAVEAVNKLKGAGRWVPAFEVAGLGLVFDELAKQTTTVEFGEGAAKRQTTAFDLLVTFLEGLPKIVPDGRIFNGTKPGERKSGTVNFTEGKGVRADSNSIALNEQAEALAKEKNISFGEALDQIVREHPELCVPGGAQAGQV